MLLSGSKKEPMVRIWVLSVIGALFFLSACGDDTSTSDATNRATPSSISQEIRAQDLDGTWQGVATGPRAGYGVEIIINAEDQSPQFTITLSDFLLSSAAISSSSPADGQVTKGKVEVRQGGPFPIGFAGEYDANSKRINGAVVTAVGQHPVSLTRTTEVFGVFKSPRLNQAGSIEQEYTYTPPAQRDDGWSVSTLEAEGIDQDLVDQMVTGVLSGELGRVETLLIARNGKLVLDEYFYGFNADRLHSIQSITKSINALLVGVAVDRGDIESVRVPAAQFFEEYEDTKWVSQEYPVSLRDMLRMSAPIDWVENISYADPQNTNTQMNLAPDWVEFVLNRDYIGGDEGTSTYMSGLSILLGAVVKNTTGLYPDELAMETLFRDLGVLEFVWLSAPDGTRHTGGGLFMKARDLLKIGEVIRTRGVWNGQQVISAEWVSQSIDDRLPLSRGDRPGVIEEYGYQWWIPTFDIEGTSIEVILGSGNGGQAVGIVPQLDAVFVFNGGEYAGTPDPKLNRYTIIRDYILPALMP